MQLVTVVLTVAVAGCASDRGANTVRDPSPARRSEAHRASADGPVDPPAAELDDDDARALASLGFLAGCWHHWDVDWGFDLAWVRRGDAWIGELVTMDAVAGSALIELRIAVVAGRLELAVRGDRFADWFGGTAVRLPASSHGPDGVRFDGRFGFERTSLATGLRFRPSDGGAAYLLSRSPTPCNATP